MAEHKFPSEVIDLPSEGKLYPEGHPLKDGKIEIKYMTAKEEDILTSQNLIKKGVVIDRLIDSLIITEGVKCNDLLLGDKNAVMVAARILAYGPEYACEVTNPNTGQMITHTFNLADCPFKKLPKGITENSFEVTLPVSKKKIKFCIAFNVIGPIPPSTSILFLFLELAACCKTLTAPLLPKLTHISK